jgi:hypothetical protein
LETIRQSGLRACAIGAVNVPTRRPGGSSLLLGFEEEGHIGWKQWRDFFLWQK